MEFPEIRPDQSFSELTSYLCRADLETLLRSGPQLGTLIPELAAELGFDQCSPHHAYDLYTHTAHVTAAVPAEPVMRWAALLHDVGKVSSFTRDSSGRGHFYGHGPAGAQLAEQILDRLGAPEALRQKAVLLVRLHMDRLKPDRDQLIRAIALYGPELMQKLLTLQEADMHSKGTDEHVCDPSTETVRTLLAELTDTLVTRPVTQGGIT